MAVCELAGLLVGARTCARGESRVAGRAQLAPAPRARARRLCRQPAGAGAALPSRPTRPPALSPARPPSAQTPDNRRPPPSQDGELVDPAALELFASRVEASYRRANAYHNDRHAADVTQMTFLILTSADAALRAAGGRGAAISKLHWLCALAAAAAHDAAHPGLTNDFLIRSKSELAEQYGGG